VRRCARNLKNNGNHAVNKDTRRLWLSLVGAVALLALNAISTVLGWSPFAPMVNEQIRERSQAADAVSAAKRSEARQAKTLVIDLKQERNHSRRLSRRPKPEQNEQPVVTDADTKQVTTPELTVISSPVAPQRPVAPLTPGVPEMSPRPVAPQAPSYILYYPDGSVRYLSTPVYPANMTVYPGQPQ
jgi:hypothetical protein